MLRAEHWHVAREADRLCGRGNLFCPAPVRCGMRKRAVRPRFRQEPIAPAVPSASRPLARPESRFMRAPSHRHHGDIAADATDPSSVRLNAERDGNSRRADCGRHVDRRVTLGGVFSIRLHKPFFHSPPNLSLSRSAIIPCLWPRCGRGVLLVRGEGDHSCGDKFKFMYWQWFHAIAPRPKRSKWEITMPGTKHRQ